MVTDPVTSLLGVAGLDWAEGRRVVVTDHRSELSGKTSPRETGLRDPESTRNLQLTWPGHPQCGASSPGGFTRTRRALERRTVSAET